MSTNFIEIVQIDDIVPHPTPGTETLELAIIRGTQSAVTKGKFTKGETVIFFPPDMLIPEHVGELLGVKKYLKHAMMDGFKRQCRVAACRLRHEPSFGFVIPYSHAPTQVVVPIGTNVDHWFDARKYEPPIRISEDAEPDDARFHKYTSIEHYWRYPDAIPSGTLVRITEKIHGTNSRVGYVETPNGYEWMAGSHRVRRRKPEPPKKSLYWSPLDNPKLVEMIDIISCKERSVIVFGEIYGGTVQDMDYGVAGATGYRVFDISIDGKYADFDCVRDYCDAYGIETVPLLYEGPFSAELVKEHTYGPTTLASADEIQAKFKLREGCVITPLNEVFYAPTGGRLILKSVSADYLDRKGAQDNE